MNKRVKIVATLGPAVEIRGGKKFGEDGYWAEKLDVEASAQNIAKLIEAGANTFRFNFSHGDHQEQGERMATVKRAEEIAGKKVGYLLDTKPPRRSPPQAGRRRRAAGHFGAEFRAEL